MDSDTQSWWTAPAVLPTASAFAVVVAAWLLFGVIGRGSSSKLDMPYVDFTDGGKRPMERYAQEGESLLIRGYQEYSKKDLPFSTFNSSDTSRPLAILPTKYLEEVRNASSSKLSFNEFLNKSQISADIGAPLVTDRIIHIVRQDLNKSLNDLIQPLHQACATVVPRLIPPSQEWTPHNGFITLFQLSSRLMARVLVGDELWDNDEWHQLMMLYFHAGMIATTRVRNGWYPRSLRWMSRFMDKYVMGIYMARKKGTAILKPVIEARLAEVKSKKESNVTKSRLSDAVGWLVESHLGSAGKSSVVKHGDIMQDTAFLIAASVPSTTSTALSILMDLVDVDHAESLAQIREEISRVYAEHGSTWTRSALGSLLLVDSFMKESQRMHNLQYNTMQRLAVEPYTFRDGLHLPAGTFMVMPSRLLGLDPDLHADAGKFDAERWKRMREQGDATKNHFASVHDDMLPWGSGPHACPGRFLAQDMIKLILIHLVTQYDIKHAEGTDGHRPPDMPDHGTSAPNQGAMLLFKER